MVIIQEIKILRIILILIDWIPLAIPTPMILPINVWVVETGNPRDEANITVIVAPNVTAKPLDGFKDVILFPTMKSEKE